MYSFFLTYYSNTMDISYQTLKELVDIDSPTGFTAQAETYTMNLLRIMDYLLIKLKKELLYVSLERILLLL